MKLIVRLPGLAIVAAAALALAGTGLLLAQTTNAPASKATRIFVEKLANAPGKTMTVVVVDYPPGGSSASHRHSGPVFAYVLAGAVNSQITGGKVITYKAGESFFEPPGVAHLVSANASLTEPARLLAVIIADDGAPLVIPHP